MTDHKRLIDPDPSQLWEALRIVREKLETYGFHGTHDENRCAWRTMQRKINELFREYDRLDQALEDETMWKPRSR